MAKEGFNNQWIEICRVGDFTDASGKAVKIDNKFLSAVIANFNAADHEAPICVGHPEMDSPAFGWTKEIRLNGDRLEARFSDTNDEFEKLVEQGSYRKRSSAFYLNPPVLKHVGFLGAKPPAVKGLKNIQFNEGESVTVEILLSEEKLMEEKDVEKVAENFFSKFTNWLKKEEAKPPVLQTSSLSEADQQNLVESITAKVTEQTTAKFAEEKQSLEDRIKSLTDAVNANSASGKRAEIVSFVEGVPAANKHFLKNIGVVNFLEKCAEVDAANNNSEFVAFSDGEGDDKVEHKFTMYGWAKTFISALPQTVAFGEQFGNIRATADANVMLTPEREKELTEKMGIDDGGAK